MQTRPHIAIWICNVVIVGVAIVDPNSLQGGEPQLERVAYNNPGLVVDLGVGLWAWPLPMDFDGDGDMDLVVACPDKPYNGVYFFENPDGSKFPTFKPGRRVSNAIHNLQVSQRAGESVVLSPGWEYTDFRKVGIAKRSKLPLPTNFHRPVNYRRKQIQKTKLRANQWRYVDFDGDGVEDLVVGIGDWADYGWDNAYDRHGDWIHGPLHGVVYWSKNEGTRSKPRYGKPQLVMADGVPVDVFGMPSPSFADFDGDGDLDLLCGEFRDGFTYFQNVGSRKKPKYAKGRTPRVNGKPLKMALCMITPVAVDWDQDGDQDLIVGDEDGRVALIEHTGRTKQGVPQFKAPRYFQQEAQHLKFGALATPVAVDWDDDGDQDIVTGNTAGQIGWFENLGGKPTKWNRPILLKAADLPITIQAGPNGSIQGPCETKWGYTTFSVADWDHDGRLDIVVNSIWGKIELYRNIGTKQRPRLAKPVSIEVAWKGKPPKPAWNWWNPTGKSLVTQWRTTPVVVDWNKDGLNDLVMLDHEGYLAFYQRKKTDAGLTLLPPARIFVDRKGKSLQLNSGQAGRSGRRKLAATDWDGDGRVDFLLNSTNADLLRNHGLRDGKVVLVNEGPLDRRKLAGHTSSPTFCDWNRDSIPELLIGAEDGYMYYVPR